MKHKASLLKISFALAILTCLGHTAGTLMDIPKEQIEVSNTYSIMKQTMVPMPIGKSQNFADIFFGNNIIVSCFLLISGLIYFILSNAQKLDGDLRKILIINNLGMATISIISFLYFFPIPAVFTGLGSILGFIAIKWNE